MSAFDRALDREWVEGSPILVDPDVYRYLHGECTIEDVPERFRDLARALEAR